MAVAVAVGGWVAVAVGGWVAVVVGVWVAVAVGGWVATALAAGAKVGVGVPDELQALNSMPRVATATRTM